MDLLYDPYPAFGTDPGRCRPRPTFTYEEPADRLTNGLRFIWAIPAIVIAAVLGIAMFFVLIVSWFAIVITGKHPGGMFGFILQVFRYILQTHSYVLLMTDTYPSWSAAGAPSGSASRPPTGARTTAAAAAHPPAQPHPPAAPPTGSVRPAE